MAIYNEILAARYSRALQKLFGMKGSAATRQLAGEIAPGFVLFSGTENRGLESWKIWAQSQSVAASVGNLSAARLRNPAGSRVVAIIEKILLHTSSAATGAVVDRLPDPGANLTQLRTPVTRDLRMITGVQSSTLICSDGNPAAQAGGVQQQLFLILASNVMWDCIWPPEQEIVLSPGDCMDIYVLNTNTILNYNVFWRERALEESELVL